MLPFLVVQLLFRLLPTGRIAQRLRLLKLCSCPPILISEAHGFLRIRNQGSVVSKQRKLVPARVARSATGSVPPSKKSQRSAFPSFPSHLSFGFLYSFETSASSA